MTERISENWLKFLDPESLKMSLIQTSMYLTCWEFLKQSLIEKPRDFFAHEWRDMEAIPGPGYISKVLSLDKDPLIASMLWFREHAAVTDADVTLLRELRSHRNEIAHELPKFLANVEVSVRLEYLDFILLLLNKIDSWWIREIEIPTNPDFDAGKLTEEDLAGVKSMTMLIMPMLIAVAKGKDDDLRAVYEPLERELKQNQKVRKSTVATENPKHRNSGHA